MTLILIDPILMTTYLVMDKLPFRKTKQKRHSGKYDERISCRSDSSRSYLDYLCVSVYGDINTFHVITSIENENIMVHLAFLSDLLKLTKLIIMR